MGCALCLLLRVIIEGDLVGFGLSVVSVADWKLIRCLLVSDWVLMGFCFSMEGFGCAVWVLCCFGN